MLFLSEEQDDLKNRVRSFTDREIRPAAQELDKNGTFPRALISRMGELGFLDAVFLAKRQGARHDAVDGTIIIEEVSRGLASLGLAISPNYQCCDLLTVQGCERLASQVLYPTLRGEKLLAFALSEASGGSDALGIDTVALHSGNHWLLNGSKCWVTNAGVADGYVVAARSTVSGRSRSVSLFYVDSASKGLVIRECNQMMGMNSSPMGTIELNDCEIPDDCLIGQENEAYGFIKPLLNEGRLDMSAIAVGIAQAAMEASIAYTSTIGQYGRSLSSYQGISFMIANMYTKITTARNSLYHVASLFNAGKPCTMEVAALKLYATEMCCQVCTDAKQIQGARGLSKDSEVERLLRDAQMLTIAEGTSEICKIVISNSLFRSKN